MGTVVAVTISGPQPPPHFPFEPTYWMVGSKPPPFSLVSVRPSDRKSHSAARRKRPSLRQIGHFTDSRSEPNFQAGTLPERVGWRAVPGDRGSAWWSHRPPSRNAHANGKSQPSNSASRR